jgi:transcriptional regulator with XRE-family HTH domain
MSKPTTKAPPRGPERSSAQPKLAASDFGSRLRRARTEREKTLREVSERSGVSITYLSDLERGVLVNPTLDTLKKIAEALDVSLNELLGVSTEKTSARYPHALEEFRRGEHFRDALAQQAQRERVSTEELEEDWLRVMAGIRIRGRAPNNSSDYLFIFEAIRRALDRR